MGPAHLGRKRSVCVPCLTLFICWGKFDETCKTQCRSGSHRRVSCLRNHAMPQSRQVLPQPTNWYAGLRFRREATPLLIFQKNEKLFRLLPTRYLKNFQNKKICWKPFWRASEYARVILSVRECFLAVIVKFQHARLSAFCQILLCLHEMLPAN